MTEPKYITKACIVCGKEITVHNDPYTIERRKHCSRKCGGVTRRAKTRQTKNCEHCGKEFGLDIPPKVLKTQKFCSASCGALNRPHPKDPNKHSIFTCKWCSKTFEDYTYRNPQYCSHQCMSEFAARQPKVKARRPERFVELQCEICQKLYTVHILQNSNGLKSRFCSTTCRDIERSQVMRGAGNHNYKGSPKNDRGGSWSTKRKQALKRDGCRCQICGYRHRIGVKRRKIDVHHITPYRQFNGDHVTANDLSNLIVLCRKCHFKVEFHGLPCPRPLL